MNIRNNARAFIINEDNEILLEKFEFTFTGKKKVLWVTPGGGVENGESFEQALERELFEELGLNLNVNSKSILMLDIPFNGKNGDFISHEVYYLIKIPRNTNFKFENMGDTEKATFHKLKWWNINELNSTNDEFEPRESILNILARINEQNE